MIREEVLVYKRTLEERTIQLKMLQKITQNISSNWELSRILDSIIKSIKNYIHSDSCFIYLIEGDTLILEASQNPHQKELGKISLKKGEGITGWVALHKKTVAIPRNAYMDERFKFFNTLPEDQYEAFLSLPITFKDCAIGVINIQHKKETVYKKDALLFLEMIAREIGGAIEHARLVGETHLLKEALETRKLVERAKSILIKKYGTNEPEAHNLLLKTSMNKRKSIREVAEAIILSDEVSNMN